MAEILHRHYSVSTRKANGLRHAGYSIKSETIDEKFDTLSKAYKAMCNYLIPYFFGAYTEIEIDINGTKAECKMPIIENDE